MKPYKKWDIKITSYTPDVNTKTAQWKDPSQCSPFWLVNWRRSQQNSAVWLASKTVNQKEADTVDNDMVSLSDFILHLMSLNTCDTYVVFFYFILLSCISLLYLNIAFRLFHDVSQE